MIDLEAIRARNEQRKRDCRPSDRNNCNFDDHYTCVIHAHINSAPDDIDVLLAECEERIGIAVSIEANARMRLQVYELQAEVDRLRAEGCCRLCPVCNAELEG